MGKGGTAERRSFFERKRPKKEQVPTQSRLPCQKRTSERVSFLHGSKIRIKGGLPKRFAEQSFVGKEGTAERRCVFQAFVLEKQYFFGFGRFFLKCVV